MMTIRELCYELYKEDWISSRDGLKPPLEAYYLALRNNDICEDVSYEEYLEEFGYGGMIYACYDEFLENEYLEEEYIQSLLVDKSLFAEYQADRETLIMEIER